MAKAKPNVRYRFHLFKQRRLEMKYVVQKANHVINGRLRQLLEAALVIVIATGIQKAMAFSGMDLDTRRLAQLFKLIYVLLRELRLGNRILITNMYKLWRQGVLLSAHQVLIR